ncbi:hypothetical protein [Cellulomonas sp. Marseille-Q8402]
MADENRPDLSALTSAASDIFAVQRVFGTAYEREGTLVVPVAKLIGSHGVAGAHADARLGVRKGRPGDAGAHGEADEHGQHGQGPRTVGAEVAEDVPAPAEGGPPSPWHHGPGRGSGGRGPQWPQWPFGSGRPAGRSGGQADAGAYAGRIKPIGVYVISDDGVRWQPALDLNRVILGGQVVGAVTASVVALAWAFRRRR